MQSMHEYPGFLVTRVRMRITKNALKGINSIGFEGDLPQLKTSKRFRSRTRGLCEDFRFSIAPAWGEDGEKRAGEGETGGIRP